MGGQAMESADNGGPMIRLFILRIIALPFVAVFIVLTPLMWLMAFICDGSDVDYWYLTKEMAGSMWPKS